MRVTVVGRSLPLPSNDGSGTYIISFLRYLRRRGVEVQYLSTGSDPGGLYPGYIVPAATAEACSRLTVMGNVRIGRLLLRLSPWAWIAPIRAALAWVRGVLAWVRGGVRVRLGEAFGWQLPHGEASPLRAPEAMQLPPWDAPVTVGERSFVAAQLRKTQRHALLVDYAFLGEILDLVDDHEGILRGIITHDVMHQRVADFRTIGVESGHSHWDMERELGELRKAHVLLAIQEDDAAAFKKLVPECRVVLTPMAAEQHDHQQSEQVPGRCLFVGSAAEQNVNGLVWFLEEAWPAVLESEPHAVLHVCGTVCGQVHGEFPNTRFLGRVEDLGPEYGSAEVCVVPLRVGSGLKIKLIEALSHGRACVSTSAGIQGLRGVTDGPVLLADTALAFGQAVCRLLGDAGRRVWTERAARKFVTEHLSRDAAYGPFVEDLTRHCSTCEMANCP